MFWGWYGRDDSLRRRHLKIRPPQTASQEHGGGGASPRQDGIPTSAANLRRETATDINKSWAITTTTFSASNERPEFRHQPVTHTHTPPDSHITSPGTTAISHTMHSLSRAQHLFPLAKHHSTGKRHAATARRPLSLRSPPAGEPGREAAGAAR